MDDPDAKIKQYREKGTFVFHIVNFSFLDGDVPLVPSYGVYISQFIIPFAHICNNISDCNDRNLVKTEKNTFTPRIPLSWNIKNFYKMLLPL